MKSRPNEANRYGTRYPNSIYSDTIKHVGIEDIVQEMRKNPKGIRFKDLRQVCDSYFGKPRKSSTSHRVYKTPWPGDPRVNIQNKKGMAKAYQVKQVLRAIELMEVEHDTGE